MTDEEFKQRARQLCQNVAPEPQHTSLGAAALDLVAALAEKNAPRENEVMGEDGLLHCAVCGGKRQTRLDGIPELNKPPTVVRCRCSCPTEAELRQQAQERELENDRRERRRAACFARKDAEGKVLGVSRETEWRFSADNGRQPELMAKAREYVARFPQYLKEGRGLLFYGPVGVGKTFAAACIANAVIDMGYSAVKTDFTTVRLGLFSAKDKQKFINDLCDPDLLIIDDLGVESKSEYMQETVFNVINSRYLTGKPMIITTNLTRAELSAPAEIGYKRIYDRIPERSLAIHVAGDSMRTDFAVANKMQMRQQLGKGGASA